MTQLISLVLPFPVSVNAMFRNVLHVGRVKTQEYKRWQDEAAMAVLVNKVCGKIDGAYAIHVEIDRPDKRRRDLSNLLKSIEDFCVLQGFVEDDSLCTSIKMKWTDAIEGRPGPCRVWLIATGGKDD